MIGRSRSNIVSSVEFNNILLTDGIVLAEGFNEYFCNVANELVQNTEQTSVSFGDFLLDPVPHSFYLSRATQVEVHETIQSLKITSAGHDDIHVKIIKACSEAVSPYLDHISSKSFQWGHFPKQLQLVKLVPVY